jgi:hypothetical protein
VRHGLEWNNPEIEPFAWLADADTHLRSGLKALGARIRRGEYRGRKNARRRRDILAMLAALHTRTRPPLTTRQRNSLVRIYAAMEHDMLNQRLEALEDLRS